MTSPPDRNLVINVALAEYTALRAEVTNRISGQDTMLNLYMTATAAIFGLALSGHPNSLILLVLPLLSAAARLLYHNHNLYIRLVSAYLNDQLRPLITDRVGEPRLLGWTSGLHNINAGRSEAGLRMPPDWRCSSRSPQPWRLSWSCPGLHPPWTWPDWSSGWLLLLAQVAPTNRRVSSV